ncbi:unnamed protein product [Mycena citricolor]|uniref:Uncharacterized protein n=1 Tax=Mycena citricolor TaxID=2018698 RepID=A0AAD2H143_9AGAR|nr:unnamed protein product [Mycena citricolor]
MPLQLVHQQSLYSIFSLFSILPGKREQPETNSGPITTWWARQTHLLSGAGFDVFHPAALTIMLVLILQLHGYAVHRPIHPFSPPSLASFPLASFARLASPRLATTLPCAPRRYSLSRRRAPTRMTHACKGATPTRRVAARVTPVSLRPSNDNTGRTHNPCRSDTESWPDSTRKRMQIAPVPAC